MPGGAGAARLVSKLGVEYGDDAFKIALKFKDDIGQLLFKAGNSKKLGKNLIEAGFKRGKDQDDHHIVAGGSKHSKDTRKILAKFNIDINSAVNGVFMNKKVHARMHTKNYYDWINRKL